MRDLPSGTITFLFTDIEGSTMRWEKFPDTMQAALPRHDAILRQAIEANRGHVFTTVGDAFCAAFATAPQALAAALAGQRALNAQDWGEVAPLRVRMALHTGTAEEHDGNYSGPTVDRINHLLPAGHGGQTLLSMSSAELLRDQLPPKARLVDMGERRLRDLTHREHIFQILVEDLPHDFPPLKTLDDRPNNLPARPTPLIGRQRELAECIEMLGRPGARLLTLTGPGGIGKTRLALHVGAAVLDNFTDGVYFVSLGSTGDPQQVIPAIAQILGVREKSGQSLAGSLIDYVRDKELLLLLDNFEQVLDAAPSVWSLLAAAPRLRIIVTSRAALRLAAEQEYMVPPLSLPGPDHPLSRERLMQCEAIALFVARAQAVKPDFQLDAENAAEVAQICLQLEGLPLAIELAAARVKILSVPMLLARLGSRLKLLTGGGRDLPARQQTMRATIGWSYDLLNEEDKRLFRRLSVFVPGCTLAAVEAVCGDCDDALDALSSLVDKSLLRQHQGDDGEMRFGMLAIIQEYGRERLAESGEEDALRRQHARFYLELAESAEPELRGAQQGRWLNCLEEEHDNLQAAMAWSIERGEAETGLAIAGSLWRFWYMRSYFTTGRKWLSALLELPGGQERSPQRAHALNGLGNLAYSQGDYAPARAAHEQSLAISRSLEDQRGVAAALNNLALIARAEACYADACTLLEQALALNRKLGNRGWEASNLNNLGGVMHAQGDYKAARALQEQSLRLFTALSDRWGMAQALGELGDAVADQAEFQTAHDLYERSLALRRELGDKRGVAATLISMGLVAWKQGEYETARSLFEEGLAVFRDLGDKRGIAAALNHLGNVALYRADLARAARLYHESQALRIEVGDKRDIASSYNNLGLTALEQGDFARAEERLTTAIELWREIGDRVIISTSLGNLGRAALYQGKHEQAETLFDEALALARAAGDRWTTAYALSGLGQLALRSGDLGRARPMLVESLRIRQELGDKRGVARGLLGMARAGWESGQAERMVQLAGAAGALMAAIGVEMEPAYRDDYERIMAQARRQMGDEQYAAAWERGRAMTPDEAVAYAVGKP